jgi:hypothetical protein
MDGSDVALVWVALCALVAIFIRGAFFEDRNGAGTDALRDAE